MRAVICPVCCGKGTIIKGSLSGISSSNEEVTCHGCGGSGWVIVPD